MSKITVTSCEQFSQGETCNPGQTSVAKFCGGPMSTSYKVPPASVGIITYMPPQRYHTDRWWGSKRQK